MQQTGANVIFKIDWKCIIELNVYMNINPIRGKDISELLCLAVCNISTSNDKEMFSKGV